MLATAGALPADGDGWAFEIKWDGVRTILFVEGGRVRAQSRNDLDVTGAFPELADVGEFLGMTACVLDGEIVALGDDGKPSFARLQHRMHVANRREAQRRAAGDPVNFVVFDLLYLDGHSLLEETYDQRRTRLESLELAGATFTTTDSFRDVDGQDILSATVANGLEGIVAKRRSSPYRAGRRSPDWLKVKSFRTQEAVIGGWTEGRGNATAALVPCCSACRLTTASAMWARWAPGSTRAPAARSWANSDRSPDAPVPSPAPCPAGRRRARTSCVRPGR